jgi:hypothetical protein
MPAIAGLNGLEGSRTPVQTARHTSVYIHRAMINTTAKAVIVQNLTLTGNLIDLNLTVQASPLSRSDHLLNQDHHVSLTILATNHWFLGSDSVRVIVFCS